MSPGASSLTGYRGLLWLARRETLRVWKLWTQTVLAPIMASALFIVVFGFSLSGRIRHIAPCVVRNNRDVVAYLILARPAFQRIKGITHSYVRRPRNAAVGAVSIE